MRRWWLPPTAWTVLHVCTRVVLLRICCPRLGGFGGGGCLLMRTVGG
jgi:hypothetical protein